MHAVFFKVSRLSDCQNTAGSQAVVFTSDGEVKNKNSCMTTGLGFCTLDLVSFGWLYISFTVFRRGNSVILLLSDKISSLNLG